MRATHGWASEGDFHRALEALVTEGAFPAGGRAQLLQVIGRDACVQSLLVGADIIRVRVHFSRIWDEGIQMPSGPMSARLDRPGPRMLTGGQVSLTMLSV